MHWKFLSCKEYGSGVLSPTTTTMKDEKTPEIGPPMGETGSCLSYNYLGSSKLEPLTAYVRCWDPHWCMRKITTSLGKALREHFQRTALWQSSHAIIFCSFKKTVAAIQGPALKEVLKRVLLTAVCSRTENQLVSLGLYNYVSLVRLYTGVPQEGVKTLRAAAKVVSSFLGGKRGKRFLLDYSIAHALVVRIFTGNQYIHSTQSRVPSHSRIGLWLQLWMDEMLDLTYHTLLGNLLIKESEIDRSKPVVKQEQQQQPLFGPATLIKEEPISEDSDELNHLLFEGEDQGGEEEEEKKPSLFLLERQLQYPLVDIDNDERSPQSLCGVRGDNELNDSGAMFLFKPHGRRFVTAGELCDVTELVLRGNIWREIRPTTKDFLSHIIHLLMSKPLLHKCLIRNIEAILECYCSQDPLLTCLVKDLIHITMLGNYPTAKHRPGFLARMFLRRDNLVFFRADARTTTSWFKENRKLVYYTLKEFYLYLVRLSPPVRELLEETQWHREHEEGIDLCMDEIRASLDRSYTDEYYAGIKRLAVKKLTRSIDHRVSIPIGQGLTLVEMISMKSSALTAVRNIIKRVHNSQLKYITKLRKGSFAQVLANEMRSWYSREDKDAAMERFGSGKRAVSKPVEDEDDDEEDEDSEEDLGNRMRDQSLRVIEQVWKDEFPPAFPEDTSGHKFRTSMPLIEAVEYMYGTGSEDEELSSGEEEWDTDREEEEYEEITDEELERLYKEELAMRLVEDENDEDIDRIFKEIDESGIIGKMVLIDPDDFLTQDERNAIYLAAHFAKTRYDGVFEFWWLYPLGLSADGFHWLKEMYYRFEITDMADNRLRTNLEYLFCKRPRDFYLILGFLREFLSREDPERIWLGEHVAISQIEACRAKFCVMPWEPTDVDLLGTRYYCVCGEWGDMVVGPFSEKRDSYSAGLSGVYYDALSGKVHCRKDKEECCQDELRRINMIGWAAKHGGRWYALCATCGMLTYWNMNQQSHRGPDCGQHRMNAEYATVPDGKRSVIIDGVAVTDFANRKRSDPPEMDRLFMARKRVGVTQREVTRQCFFCRTDGRGSQGVAVWVLRVPRAYDCVDYSRKASWGPDNPALYSGKTRNGDELLKLNPTTSMQKHHNSCLDDYNELGRFEGGQTLEEVESRNVRYTKPQLVRVWLCKQDWKNARAMLVQYPVPFMQDLISWINTARKQKLRKSKTRRIIKDSIV
jgi:hypothetical protein